MSLTCSATRAAVGEQLAGTAPHAEVWVLLEQPGPWGRDALTESHLPVATGRALADLAHDRPVRIGLIRSVGAHADNHDGPRTLLIARTSTPGSWIAARLVHDVSALPNLLDVDRLLAATAAPDDLAGVPIPAPARVLLVCTNAKRDQCCAVLGRPLAASLSSSATGTNVEVWETSHTGGHRFAPTFVSLPDGYLYGGTDAATQSLGACRGRSALTPDAQVAELAVLRHVGAAEPRPLKVEQAGAFWRVEAGGQSFSVSVDSTPSVERPESCGKPPVPSRQWSSSVTHHTG